jgi:hypothetical protein
MTQEEFDEINGKIAKMAVVIFSFLIILVLAGVIK